MWILNGCDACQLGCSDNIYALMGTHAILVMFCRYSCKPVMEVE